MARVRRLLALYLDGADASSPRLHLTPGVLRGLPPLDRYTALAALTHDPKIDDAPLAAALKAGCFYVGALGSRRTHAKRVERLAALGVDEAAVSRIRAPIGLDIGAVSPAEIAVSVLAQVIASLRQDRRRAQA